MSSENTTPLLRNEKRHKHTHTHKDQVERTHLVVDGTLLLRARKKRDANTRLTVKLPNISLGISHLLSVENGERTRKRKKKKKTSPPKSRRTRMEVESGPKLINTTAKEEGKEFQPHGSSTNTQGDFPSYEKKSLYLPGAGRGGIKIIQYTQKKKEQVDMMATPSGGQFNNPSLHGIPQLFFFKSLSK